MLRLVCTVVAASLVSATADSSATRWEAAKLVSGFLGLDKQREASESFLTWQALAHVVSFP